MINQVSKLLGFLIIGMVFWHILTLTYLIIFGLIMSSKFRSAVWLWLMSYKKPPKTLKV